MCCDNETEDPLLMHHLTQTANTQPHHILTMSLAFLLIIRGKTRS